MKFFRRRRIMFIAIVIPVAVIAQRKITVVGFSSTECDDGTALYDLLRIRIIERKFSNGMLEIKVGTTETCCLSFKPVVKYYSSVNDGADTLYLGYRTNDEPCECVCYYEMTYRLQGFGNDSFDVRFKGKPIEFSNEKYKTYPIQYRLVGEDTVNFVDKYGMRQGVWTFDSLPVTRYYFFENSVPMKIVLLYPSGGTRSEATREHDNWNHYIEYFETGQKKKECHNDRPAESYNGTYGKCKAWDAHGQLLYEGPYKKD